MVDCGAVTSASNGKPEPRGVLSVPVPTPGVVMPTISFMLESVIALLLTGLIVFSFRDLLLDHAELSVFVLPISVGLHGKVSAAISSSLASGMPLRLDDWLAVVWQACLSDSWMASCTGLFYAFVACFLPRFSTQVGLIVAIALPIVACWRIVLAGLFPLLTVRLGLDPTATATPLMATVGQASGLFLFFSLARVLLHVMPAFK
ncbi:hypothetical protein D9Q98_004027 [Chlorella vulgaris]|uniref:SLC41A/MgtE integral membrane domain-containing protein n=1 Tax=Chlorella vulgaris TaxID=3077 RepID=A0A9D4TR28_CHLVU|nr:hypothetical protein D9Q98_004027 [Chlorella vulgaris]